MEETGTKEKKKCNICRKTIQTNKNNQACLRRPPQAGMLRGDKRDTKDLDGEKWICITCTKIEEKQGRRRTGDPGVTVECGFDHVKEG